MHARGRALWADFGQDPIRVNLQEPETEVRPTSGQNQRHRFGEKNSAREVSSCNFVVTSQIDSTKSELAKPVLYNFFAPKPRSFFIFSKKLKPEKNSTVLIKGFFRLKLNKSVVKVVAWILIEPI